MGLLSVEAKTAIANGNPIRQYWAIWTPEANGAEWDTEYEENAIHGVPSTGGTAVDATVIDAGSRTQTAYNVALRDLGDLDAGEYTITVDVSNGKFNSDAGGYFLEGSYEADPQQCILQHEVYVVLDDGSNVVLSDWYGRITRFGTESLRHADGTTQQTIGTITARPMVADVLEQRWRAADNWKTTIEASYDTPYAVYVPSDNISTGWYRDNQSGNKWDYHIWIDLTAYLPRAGTDPDYIMEVQMIYESSSPVITHFIIAASSATTSGDNAQVEITVASGFDGGITDTHFLRTNSVISYEVRVYEDGDESIAVIPAIPNHDVDNSGNGTNPPA